MFFKAKQRIVVRMFFELMGWPKDALNKTLKNIIHTHLAKRIKILKEEYSEPEKVEGTQKMFISHVEIEAEIPDIKDLFVITLSFAPSVVEILEPPELIITAHDLQDVLADISSKVQELDKQVKVLAAHVKKLKENASKSQKEQEKPANENSSKIVIE